MCLGVGEKVENLQDRTAGYRSREQLMLQFQFESCCRQNSFFFLGVKSFFLLRPSTDRMSPNPIMEPNLRYSQSSDLNVNLILGISSQ